MTKGQKLEIEKQKAWLLENRDMPYLLLGMTTDTSEGVAFEDNPYDWDIRIRYLIGSVFKRIGRNYQINIYDVEWVLLARDPRYKRIKEKRVTLGELLTIDTAQLMGL